MLKVKISAIYQILKSGQDSPWLCLNHLSLCGSVPSPAHLGQRQGELRKAPHPWPAGFRMKMKTDTGQGTCVWPSHQKLPSSSWGDGDEEGRKTRFSRETINVGLRNGKGQSAFQTPLSFTPVIYRIILCVCYMRSSLKYPFESDNKKELLICRYFIEMKMYLRFQQLSCSV